MRSLGARQLGHEVSPAGESSRRYTEPLLTGILRCSGFLLSYNRGESLCQSAADPFCSFAAA